MNKDIPQEIKDNAKALHQQWLRDPITVNALRIIDKQRESVSILIAGKAMGETITDQYIRLLAVQLATLNTIKTLLYDSEKFVEKL